MHACAAISLLLAAGAAADASAKFLALEQDWATDKVGLFFQHKDFETAWSNIQRDIEPQLKAAIGPTLDFIFMGTGMTPIAELLVLARARRDSRTPAGHTVARPRALLRQNLPRRRHGRHRASASCWATYVTPALAVLGDDGVAGPLRCEQRAGDVMVVPSSWGRAARHDEPTIGCPEVAFDREHTDGFGEFYGTESWRQTEEVVY